MNKIQINRERVTGKEQYYTNPDVALKCVQLLQPFVHQDTLLLEPCAGTGSFLSAFSTVLPQNTVLAVDIEPKIAHIEQQDFLEMDLSSIQQQFVACTNPPFGRMHSLCIKFFNHLASSPNCSHIGFLVPRSWRKWSIQNRLSQQYHLVLDEEMPLRAFHSSSGEEFGSDILKTVFQVWERGVLPRELIIPEDRGYFKKTTPEKADVAFTAFGYTTGKVETTFERKPNSTKLFLSVSGPEVVSALRSININTLAGNVAYTKVISQSELRHLLNEYFDCH